MTAEEKWLFLRSTQKCHHSLRRVQRTDSASAEEGGAQLRPASEAWLAHCSAPASALPHQQLSLASLTRVFVCPSDPYSHLHMGLRMSPFSK